MDFIRNDVDSPLKGMLIFRRMSVMLTKKRDRALPQLEGDVWWPSILLSHQFATFQPFSKTGAVLGMFWWENHHVTDMSVSLILRQYYVSMVAVNC